MDARRAATVTTLIYLVRSLLATPDSQRPRVAGPRAKPWCEILERATRGIQRDIRPVVVPLIMEALKQADQFTPEQRGLVSLAARRALEFAWSEPHRDRGMIRAAIEGVCRTFESAPGDSEALIRRLLARDHLAAHGYDELPTLAGEIEGLLARAPGLVEEVYRAALGYREADDAPTEMGDGLILRLHSNRRQDYELAIHKLGDAYPLLMDVAPVQATGVVIAAVEFEVYRKARVPVETLSGEAFRVGDQEVRFVEDCSHIWDAARHRHEIHMQILDAFEEGLVSLAGSAQNTAQLDEVLARLIRDNRFAAIWRKLLSAASREPTTLGTRVWQFLAATPVLSSWETVEFAGKCLQAVFQHLGQAEREAIERAILSIQAPSPDQARSFLDRQNRLLGCLPATHVVTSEAQARIQEMAQAGGAPPNDPPFALGDMTWGGEYTEAQWLADQGVQLEAEPNRRLRELTEPLASFARSFANQAPSADEAGAVVPGLSELHDALRERASGADPRVVASAWTHIAAAAAALAGAAWLETDPSTAQLIRSLLLAASRHEIPRPSPEQDARYEENGLVSASPRWHAAGGLLDFVRFPKFVDEEVVGAIRRLGQDPCPEVRAEVARNLPALYHTANQAFWDLLRRVEGAESSRRIIHDTLSTVCELARLRTEEMRGIAHTVFHRFRDDPEASEVRRSCLNVALLANERGDDPYGGELVNTVISNMAGFTDEARFLVILASARLTRGSVEPPDPLAEKLRLASFTFLHGIAKAVRDWVAVLQERARTHVDAPSADIRHQVQAVHRVASELGLRVYFASGAYDEQMALQQTPEITLTEGAKRRFLHESLHLLGVLAELGFPEVTHHVLQTLDSYSEVDPRGVFLAVWRAVRFGEAGGYQHDSLAADLVVTIVRRYLAEHRVLFREDRECREALTETLNTFVRAGWPAALGVTFRLEEIYR